MGNNSFYQKPAKEVEKQYCECGKIIYLTWEQAQHSINFMHNKSGGHGKWGSRVNAKKVPIRVYQCPICHYFHTTSQNMTEHQLKTGKLSYSDYKKQKQNKKQLPLIGSLEDED